VDTKRLAIIGPRTTQSSGAVKEQGRAFLFSIFPICHRLETAQWVQLRVGLVRVITMWVSLTPRFIEVLMGGSDCNCFNSFGVFRDKPLKRFCVSGSPRHPTESWVLMRDYAKEGRAISMSRSLLRTSPLSITCPAQCLLWTEPGPFARPKSKRQMEKNGNDGK
jgi:hypothetical protein